LRRICSDQILILIWWLQYWFLRFSGFVLSLHKDFHSSIQQLKLASSTRQKATRLLVFRNDAARGDAPLGLVRIIHHCMWRKSSKKRSFVIHHHSSFTDGCTDTQFVIIYKMLTN
jgi:hypothetical protein